MNEKQDLQPDEQSQSRRPKLARLDTMAQYRTLLSPVRFEIFECMRYLAPCSIPELAVQLDRATDSLYLHVRKLERAGIIREVGFRKNGRHVETLFDIIADNIDFTHLRGSTGEKIVGIAGKLFLSVGRKTLREALESHAVRFEPGERNLAILNSLAWLTREDYAKVRAHIIKITEILDEARPRREGELFMVLNLISPVIRKSRPAAPAPRQRRNAHKAKVADPGSETSDRAIE